MFADTKSALFNAAAVRVTGQQIKSGQTVTIDFLGVGQDSRVTETGAGMRLQLIKVGGQLYVNASESFWSAHGAGAHASSVANKWIKIAASQVGDVSQLSLQGLAASLVNDSPLKPQVTGATVAGKPAVVVHQMDGSQLFVSATGAPVPLKAINTGASRGTLNFEYGQQPAITAPRGAITAQQALGQPTTGNA